jgi:hypothetical protein
MEITGKKDRDAQQKRRVFCEFLKNNWITCFSSGGRFLSSKVTTQHDAPGYYRFFALLLDFATKCI